MAGSFKHKIGINEVSLKNNNIWKAVLAEFLGTFILNFFGCLSCTTGNITAISLAFGLAVFMVVMVSLFKIKMILFLENQTTSCCD